MNEEAKPPVKVGEILKLGVERFGKEGDPILLHKGFIIFLKELKGEYIPLNTLIEIRITKVLPKFAISQLAETRKG